MKTSTKTVNATATKTVTKADQALAIVRSVYADKQDGVSSRQRALAALESIGLAQPTARQTYLQNTLTKLRNEQSEEAAKRIEAGKPVWSVVKVDHNNLVSAVGLFVSAGDAKKFNETFEHHAVVKGVASLGDSIEPKLVKKVAKSPRTVKAKEVEVVAKVTKAKKSTSAKKAA